MEETPNINLCLNCGKPIIGGYRCKGLLRFNYHKGCKQKFIQKGGMKECDCGCKMLMPRFDARGKPRRYIIGHNHGYNAYTKRTTKKRYIDIRIEHPLIRKSKWFPEHRYIWEQHHKAIVLPWGIVHHKNKNKHDNRIENLQGMTKWQHAKLHSDERRDPKTGKFT